MQNIFRSNDMQLSLEYNRAWLHLPDAEPVLVIAVTKIVWRGVEHPVSLAVKTNVFDANLGIAAIAKEIFTDLSYVIGS